MDIPKGILHLYHNNMSCGNTITHVETTEATCHPHVHVQCIRCSVLHVPVALLMTTTVHRCVCSQIVLFALTSSIPICA